jgi:predicted nucleic acid-binding protein
VIEFSQHLREPWILIIDWSLSSVQVERSPAFQLEQSHLEKVDCNALCQYGFRAWGDTLSRNVSIIHKFKELHIDVVVTDAVAAATTQAVGKPQLHG